MIALMFAVSLSTLSPEQRADFACLRVAVALESLETDNPPHLRQAPSVQRALRRLKRADTTRDWMAEAAPFPKTTTYREFMKWVELCQSGAHARAMVGSAY